MGLFDPNVIEDKTKVLKHGNILVEIRDSELGQILFGSILSQLEAKSDNSKFLKIGYYVPEDMDTDFLQELKKRIENWRIHMMEIDCKYNKVTKQYASAENFMYRDVHIRPYSVLIFDHFNETPDSEEKEAIEKLLYYSWKNPIIKVRDKEIDTSKYLVIFLAYEGTAVTPERYINAGIDWRDLVKTVKDKEQES